MWTLYHAPRWDRYRRGSIQSWRRYRMKVIIEGRMWIDSSNTWVDLLDWHITSHLESSPPGNLNGLLILSSKVMVFPLFLSTFIISLSSRWTLFDTHRIIMRTWLKEVLGSIEMTPIIIHYQSDYRMILFTVTQRESRYFSWDAIPHIRGIIPNH